MNEQIKKELEVLQERKRKFINAGKESGDWEGIEALLPKFYEKKEHFIYELIQNAEDCKATKVRFTVLDDQLQFRHNGRKFDIRDIESICTIAKSSKDGNGKIGKFGIGFKSVYIFTNTPSIYSDDICFQIQKMLIPIEIDNNYKLQCQADETIFIFPFDNPQRKETASKDLDLWLQQIDGNTLLFLNHIKSIEYFLSDGRKGFLEMTNSNSDNRFCHLNTLLDNSQKDQSDWLKFTKHVELKIPNDKGKLEDKQIKIDVAYNLAKNDSNSMQNNTDKEKLNENKNKWDIVPTDDKVYIYFLAEAEKSNLRFYINAPFACPPSRDRVYQKDENNKILLQSLSQLIAESIPQIKDLGLLTTNFFDILPNNQDLDPFYKPIQESIFKVFQEQDLIPLVDGGFGRYNSVIRTSKDVRKWLTQLDIQMIYKDPKLSYMLNP